MSTRQFQICLTVKMELNDDKLVEDVVIDENFNPDEILHVFMAAFSLAEKDMISNLLLEDFKKFFLQMGPSVVNSNLHKKARFVSCFGYTSRVNFYYGVKMFIINHLRNEIKPHVLNAPNHTFLKSLVTAWEIYLEALTTINNVMDYMESIHSGHNKLEHFDKFGIILFRCMIFQDDEVQSHMLQSLIEMKRVTVRDSILLSSDRLLIEDFSKMCVVLKMDTFYECYVKSLFMRLTTKFFQSISEDYLFKFCACSYFKNVDTKITQEMDRIQFYLETKTVDEIYDIIKTELILKNMKTVVEMKNCGVVYMLKNNQDDDLKWMYNFLSSVDGGVKVMFESMCSYFRELGTTVVLESKGNSNAITCIQSLLNLKDKFDSLSQNLFNNDRLFYEIVGSEFGFFLKFNSLIPKFLSIFIDLRLRRGKNMFIRNNTMVEMEKIVFLIKHLQDKSDFEKFYRINLADRLLFYRNVNMKIENRMISKLKKAYVNGYGYSNSLFASRIEGMWKDKFLLSKPIMLKYKEHVLVKKCILGNLQPFDLNVDVINSVYWPVTYQKSMCRIPSIALDAFNDFKTFYSKGETRKTLKLLPQFGTVELDAIFYNSAPWSSKRSCDGEYLTANNQCVERKCNVTVTTYQMFVLDLFNTNDFLTYERILRETMIPERSLLTALHGLVQFHQLLLKFPNCREIKLNDRFYINEFFRFK